MSHIRGDLKVNSTGITGVGDLILESESDLPVDITGSLTLEKTGALNNGVKVLNAYISGFLKGNIHSAYDVQIDENAKVVGNIVGKSLSIMKGAHYSGHIKIEDCEG
jgi:cytoskeletal protein CcmA (bactofilin family)